MISARPLVFISSLMMSLLVSNPAHAWERGWGWGGMGFLTGAMVGAQLANPYRYYGYPYYYPAPITYAAPPMAIQQQPMVVQQAPMAYTPPQPTSPPQVASNSGQNWYYCVSKKSYYPYVRNCPEAWQSVAPSPPPPNHSR